MATAPKEMRHAARTSNRPRRWWHSIRRLIGAGLVGLGAAHIVDGLRTLDGGTHNYVLGGFLLAAGVLTMSLDSWRLRRHLRQPGVAAQISPEDLDRPLQLSFSHARSAGALAAAALMVAASLFILIAPWVVQHPHHPLSHAALLGSVVIGAVGLLFFGGCLLWLLLRRIDLTPALTADPLGLMDRSNALGSHTRVPWRDINGFRVKPFMGQEFVVVDLAEPQRFTRQANGLRWLALKVNQGIVGSPWTITPTLFGCTAGELAARLDARRRHYL